MIDDGSGLPSGFEERVFEPGVTSRHLEPAPRPSRHPAPAAPSAHGAGLSLYHIRQAALTAHVLRNGGPTAIQATFDTRILPERALQTHTEPSSAVRASHHARSSRTNLPATLRALLRALADVRDSTSAPDLYYSSPSRILATMLQKHIIPATDAASALEAASRVGLAVSLRTVQRVFAGSVRPVGPIGGEEGERVGPTAGRASGSGVDAAELRLGDQEIRAIQAILDGAARASYLEVGQLRAESRAGSIVLRASVYEPEEIYDD